MILNRLLKKQKKYFKPKKKRDMQELELTRFVAVFVPLLLTGLAIYFKQYDKKNE